VRAITSGDAPGLAELVYASFHGSDDDEGVTRSSARTELDQVLAGQYGPVLWDCSFLVPGDGPPVSATVVTDSPEDGGPLLAYCMTHPAHRRLGLASILVDRSLTALREAGHAELILFVMPSNRAAIRMYEGLGFTRETALVRVGHGERGRGLFAGRAIPPRTLLESCPVILVPVDEVGTGVLARYVFWWTVDEVPHYALTVGHGLLYNHDPHANVDFRCDAEARCIHFWTTKAVAAGEELLIDYEYDERHLAKLDHPEWYRASHSRR